MFLGDGEVLPEMRRLAQRLGLDDVVVFSGRADDDEIVRVLSSADVCLAPDPSSPLNDVSTMVKIAEYMAMRRPVVSFDLPESRFTAAEAALYAPPNDERAFAGCIDRLLDDPALRATLGAAGKERVDSELSWARSDGVVARGV